MQNFGIIFRLSTLASLRSRWFWGYTIIIFGFIALIFSSGVTDSRVMGFTGLTRLLVIFIQACNLVLPVFILVSTVRTLVKERETNVFEYLLSYPISLGDYYWGKAACAVITTMAPLAAALAGAALGSCFMGQTASVGLIALYTALLLASSLFFIGLSFLISSVVRTQEAGLTCALLIWLTLIALLDVALLGFLIKLQVPENIIYAAALLNPVQVFKIAALSLFDPVLTVLGPASYFILDLFGNTLLIVTALLYLTGAGLLFLYLGYRRFTRRDLL